MTVWSIVKWPILAVIVVVVVGLLYYVTPNVQQPKFRWISVGAGVAIVVWVLASVGVRVLRGRLLVATTRPTGRWQA